MTWPDDRALRDRLARSGTPRIVLIPLRQPRPDRELVDEVWASTSATYAELSAAAHALLRRLQQFDRALPWVDEYGTAHRGEAAVYLTRPEAVVLRELLAHEGQVVPAGRLEQLLEALGHGGDRSLEGVMYRLRLRLVELRVVVRAVRAQGFVVNVLGRTELAS